MKKLPNIFYLLLLLSFTVNAQKGIASKEVVLCEEYDKTTGTPSGIYKSWDIASDGDGSYVYLIYSQEKPIQEELNINVDKKNSSGDYLYYSTLSFDNTIKSDAKKWAMYDFNFKEEGDYRITVMGNNDISLAETYTEINFKKKAESITDLFSDEGDVMDETDEIDSDYYTNSTLTFGESIEEGVLSGESSTFRLTGDSKEITAKIAQDDELKLTDVLISIFTGTDYKEEVSSITYTIADLSWNWISVPIKFYKKGKYQVDVTSQDDVFINSGYFVVQ